MSREQMVKINFTVTWAYRLVLGGGMTIGTYFLHDIHSTIKDTAMRTQTLEKQMVEVQTEIKFLTKNQ